MKRMDKRTTTVYVKPQTGLLQRSSRSLSEINFDRSNKKINQAKYSLRNANRKMLEEQGHTQIMRKSISLAPKLFTILEIEEEGFHPIIQQREYRELIQKKHFFLQPIKKASEKISELQLQEQISLEQNGDSTNNKTCRSMRIFELQIQQEDEKKIEQILRESFKKNAQNVIYYLINQIKNDPKKVSFFIQIINYMITLFSIPEFFQYKCSQELVQEALRYSDPAQTQLIKIAIKVQIKSISVAMYKDLIEDWGFILIQTNWELI